MQKFQSKFETKPGEFYSIPMLLGWYKETLRELRKRQQRHKRRLERIKRWPKRFESRIARMEEEKRIISEWIGNLEYCIEWMETARRPGNRRGVERRSYKQREIVCDPIWVQAYNRRKQAQWDLDKPTDKELQKLDDLLGCLNKEQYECYVLIRGNCYTYENAANALGMSTSLVAYHLREAEKKLKEKVEGGIHLALQGSLF